jgi:hypothetical protein
VLASIIFFCCSSFHLKCTHNKEKFLCRCINRTDSYMLFDREKFFSYIFNETMHKKTRKRRLIIMRRSTNAILKPTQIQHVCSGNRAITQC